MQSSAAAHLTANKHTVWPRCSVWLNPDCNNTSSISMTCTAPWQACPAFASAGQHCDAICKFTAAVGRRRSQADAVNVQALTESPEEFWTRHDCTADLGITVIPEPIKRAMVLVSQHWPAYAATAALSTSILVWLASLHEQAVGMQQDLFPSTPFPTSHGTFLKRV